MRVPFVDLQAMHSDIMSETLDAITQVVRKGNFVLGNEVNEFEQDFAQYAETDHAVGVDSGLSALKLALLAYDIGPGDEVIVPANTFIATAAAVSFIGATPVFVDVPAGEYNLDPNLIEDAITERTRAIIPVHLYGTPADMDPIMEIANRHNLIVVEDASQAHGARYHGKSVGSIGHVGAFSLYPAKNLGAFGDAGIITTNDETIVDKLKAMRNVGQTKKYHHDFAPYNHRLDTIHAAVLRIKLRQLDGWNARRRQVVKWYESAFQGINVALPHVADDCESVWHLYVIRTDNRYDLLQYLSDHEIGVGIHYPFPLHVTAYYEPLGYKVGQFPVSERQADQILSLPMYPDMTEEQVKYVAEMTEQFLTPVNLMQ